MSQQTELTCVSCDTAFDPGPTGGFCPECDTPHPDFEHQTPEEDTAETDEASAGGAAQAADDAPVASGGSASDEAATTGSGAGAQTGPAYCPDCGTALADAGASAAGPDAWDCPDCGRAVTDESYCPDCGADLDAARDAATADDAAAEADTDEGDVEEAETEIAGEPASTGGADGAADVTGTPADAAGGADAATAGGTSETVTLVVNGEPYTFGDGDSFGREDEEWLEDLVKAAGGSDALSYISGEHVQFAIEDDGVYVTDVSRNGTMLNGRDLDGGRAEVEDGDYLTLAGRAEVQVTF